MAQILATDRDGTKFEQCWRWLSAPGFHMPTHALSLRCFIPEHPGAHSTATSPIAWPARTKRSLRQSCRSRHPRAGVVTVTNVPLSGSGC